ncbi:MAG TPA: aldo/keto reductase [Longimicrobiales bacterium]|nr:aldo/keto reductase [Longimicrobiales bacterium]
MYSRREWLGLTLGAGAALVFTPGCRVGGAPPPAAATGGTAAGAADLITRAIPSTGERLPIIGLGSSATFSRTARSEDHTALREVLRTLTDAGATVFDTAPGYGASEEVAGAIAAELGITDRMFWATKVNVAGRGGGDADPAAARAQIDASFEKLRTPVIDLIQVHNLGDVPTQLAILKEVKDEGRIRYLGVTTTSERQYPQLLEIMRNEPLDFIGIDYAVDNREVENEVLPLATERQIGVLVYAPFGRTRLWSRVENRELPEWAAEIDATTWAQFFLKYPASHPAVTVVTPATSQARHMTDNLGAAMGRLPDEAMRRRMVEFVDTLPPAER